MKDARGERSQQDLFLRDAQHSHGFKMLVFHILQVGVFLIIRESHAENICLPDNMMDQCAAAQLNVIWMGAEKEYIFAEEIHVVICPIQHTPEREMSRKP